MVNQRWCLHGFSPSRCDICVAGQQAINQMHDRSAPAARRTVDGLGPLDPADIPGEPPEADDGQTEATDDTAGSWAPIDLGPYLDGLVERPEPCVGLARGDGLRLIYPGLEHSIIGEMESGKTWFAAACVAAELLDSRDVVYIHFEESDPADLLGRLQALGVDQAVIRKHLRFVAPAQPVRHEQLQRLLDPSASLVILDGVNEGMSLHAKAIREEDGVAAFRRILIKPCLRAGAAVLSCDHVVKDQERRGRYALGSIHKGNALNGALILLENSEPFGRGLRGVSHVFATKDRPGHLRRHGRPTKTPGKTYLGTLVVDDERKHHSYLDLQFWPPSDQPQVTQQDDESDRVLNAIQTLQTEGIPSGLNKITAKVGFSKDKTGRILDRLVIDRRLVESHIGQMRVFTPTLENNRSYRSEPVLATPEPVSRPPLFGADRSTISDI